MYSLYFNFSVSPPPKCVQAVYPPHLVPRMVRAYPNLLNRSPESLFGPLVTLQARAFPPPLSKLDFSAPLPSAQRGQEPLLLPPPYRHIPLLATPSFMRFPPAPTPLNKHN